MPACASFSLFIRFFFHPNYLIMVPWKLSSTWRHSRKVDRSGCDRYFIILRSYTTKKNFKEGITFSKLFWRFSCPSVPVSFQTFFQGTTPRSCTVDYPPHLIIFTSILRLWDSPRDHIISEREYLRWGDPLFPCAQKLGFPGLGSLEKERGTLGMPRHWRRDQKSTRVLWDRKNFPSCQQVTSKPESLSFFLHCIPFPTTPARKWVDFHL